MALPTVQPARVGVQALIIYPWSAGSSYPFPSNVACNLYALKEMNMTKTSKSARVTGGESVHQLDAFETDRETKCKISNAKADLRYWQLLLGGTFILDLADSFGPETQYYTENLSDRSGYVTVVGVSTNGNPQELYVFPKMKMDGNIGFNLTRDAVTDIDVDLLALWDYTYVRQDGQIGGIAERFFANGAVPGFHS